MDKKYLSVFIDRLIPSFFIERYPNYRLYIKFFLEYLERGPLTEETGGPVEDLSDDGVYTKIAELIRFIDLDSIINETNLELKEKIINSLYQQMIGDVGARYLSDLLDDILYLKHQTDINYAKGTKINFQLFFALLLGGAVEVSNIENSSKIHDGTYQYNGIINYDSREGFNPYVYIVESPLLFSKWSEVLDILNPAGMFPIVRNINTIQRNFSDFETGELNSNISTFLNTDMFVSFYNEIDDFIGMIKPGRIRFATVTTDTDYDLILSNGTKLNTSENHVISTGETATHVLLNCFVNEDIFGQKNVHRIKILDKDTTSPNDNFFSTSLDTSGEGNILVDIPLDNTGEPFTIEQNVSINILLEFNTFNFIPFMIIGNNFIVT